MIPANETRKKTHCRGFTVSFTKKIPRIVANTGAKKRMVVAVANGISWINLKYRINARAPAAPLIINNLLFFPQIFTFADFRNPRLRIREITDLKKTISTAGMWGKSFTPTFITEKNRVANIIYQTPFVIMWLLMMG
jgi:hypothetical protein